MRLRLALLALVSFCVAAKAQTNFLRDDGTVSNQLGIAGTSTGQLKLSGSTSGVVTITPQVTAGTVTLTLPNASGTVADSATSPLSLNATTGALSISAIPNSGLAAMNANTIKGNNTGSPATPTDLTGAQVEALLQFTQSASGGVQRTVDSLLQEKWPSVKDFGAVCDGTTDDATHITAAMAAFKPAYIPPGVTCKVSTAGSSLSGLLFGNGIIKEASSNTIPGFFSSISAAPGSTCNPFGSVDTAFNCDITKVLFPSEARIAGSATLGQPTTGYLYTPNAYPHYSVLFNSSGFNNSTSDTTGRTAVVDYMSNVFQSGQGDAVSFNAECTLGSQTRASATNFLAEPACVLFNGVAFAGAAGQFLSPSQLQMEDNGHDVAGVGIDINTQRTVNTGALGAYWGAFVSQSVGSKAIDYGYGALGPHVVGLDFTPATFQTNKSAVVIKDGDRIYLNGASSNGAFATSIGTESIGYSSSAGGFAPIIGNKTSIILDANGHVRASTNTPSLSSCGTTPTLFGASDIAGTIETGTGSPTGCVLTFAVAYSSPPNCIVTWQANLALMHYSSSALGITITQTATSNNFINYQCTAAPGG